MEETKEAAVSPNVYFTKQTVQNACGTVGIIHALANNRHHLDIDLERAFGKYLRATETMTPEQSAEYLKQDEEISCAHSESANEGQTEVWVLFAVFDFLNFCNKLNSNSKTGSTGGR